MKRLLSIGVVSLFIGMTAMTLCGGQDRRGNEGIRDRLVGAWRLVSLETPGPDGKIHRTDSTGLLVFTRDGHMSVQVMERNRPPQAPAAPEQYSQGGYEATFGTFEIDESAHTFTFHVDQHQRVHDRKICDAALLVPIKTGRTMKLSVLIRFVPPQKLSFMLQERGQFGIPAWRLST